MFLWICFGYYHLPCNKNLPESVTIAYPIQNQKDYTELRYSLRSAEKYLPGSEVLIIGETVPDWVTNITQIHLPDIKGRKQLSIRAKIYAALEYAKEVLLMNDDIFLLQEPTFEYYYHGELKKYNESGAKPLLKQLEELGKPTKHFDIHYPIIYRQDFKEILSNFTSDCIIKSAYCNYLGIEGVQIPDCKLIGQVKQDQVRAMITARPCLSTGAYSLPSAIPILQELFPNKSTFEV